VLELHLAKPLDNRGGGCERGSLVVLCKEHGELVASETKSLSALPQAGCNLRQDAIARRMAVLVVNPLEVVDVDEAKAQLLPGIFCGDELTLEPFVKVAVISQARQRIGEREPHRA
jgi:hypothetical protein